MIKNIFDMILDDMVEFEAETCNKHNSTVCGDLNARTGALHNYVEYDNLQILAILPDDYVVDTPIPGLLVKILI